MNSVYDHADSHEGTHQHAHARAHSRDHACAHAHSHLCAYVYAGVDAIVYCAYGSYCNVFTCGSFGNVCACVFDIWFKHLSPLSALIRVNKSRNLDF